MENKQQTAVEWLVENAEDFFGNLLSPSITDKALQMEREQIEQAFIKGNEFVPKWKINGVPYIESEQYYDETYGK